MKRLGYAKSRLAGTLTADERAVLMRTLLDHVLTAVQAAGVSRITLVTSEPLEHDAAETWHDGDLPWNLALAEAMRELGTEDLVAVISADLPFLRPTEVEALLESTPARGVAIARASDGGTNAVAMRPPMLLRTCFGEPGSARIHAESAQARGVAHVVLDLPGLAFDVDTADDFERMRRRGGSTLTATASGHLREREGGF